MTDFSSSSLFPIRKTRKDASILVSWTLEPLERLLSLRYLWDYIYIHISILQKEKNVRSWRYYKDENRSSAYTSCTNYINPMPIGCQSNGRSSESKRADDLKKKKKRTYLSTSTFGSAFIAASRMLGSRCGSAAGENGLVGLVVMYWGDAFLNSPVLVVYVTRLEEENESPVVCSSIAENTWFWPNVTIFGEPGPDSSSLISSGTMSAGCGDRGGELGSGLDVSTVCVVPTCAKDTTETTWSAATASSVSWAITLSVCSITWCGREIFFFFLANELLCIFSSQFFLFRFFMSKEFLIATIIYFEIGAREALEIGVIKFISLQSVHDAM